MLVSSTEFIDRVTRGSVNEATKDYAAWSEMVELVRAECGELVALDRLAVLAAVHRERRSKVSSAISLFDASVPLVDRVYLASRQSREWWRELFAGQLGARELRLAVMTVFGLATARVAEAVAEQISERLERLDDAEWEDLSLAVMHVTREGGTSPRLDSAPVVGVAGIKPRAISLLIMRSNRHRQLELVESGLRAYDGVDGPILRLIESVFLSEANLGAARWVRLEGHIARGYESGISEERWQLRHVGEQRQHSIPVKVAEKILAAPAQYPLALVAGAERVLAARAGRRVEQVLKRAESEGWFTAQND